jgi:hypothetical protein
MPSLWDISAGYRDSASVAVQLSFKREGEEGEDGFTCGESANVIIGQEKER